MANTANPGTAFQPYQSDSGQTFSNTNQLPNSAAFNPAAPQPPSIQSANAPQPSKSQVPVITAQAAKDDFAAKTAAYNTLLAGMRNQADAKSQADQQAKIDQAAKDVQASNLAYQNSQVNIQKTQADTAKTLADAKLTAAQGLSQPQTPPGGAGTPATAPAAPVAPPEAPASQPQTQDPTDSLLQGEASAQSGVQDAQTQAYNDLISQTNQIRNGTFPLSPTDSAMLAATQQSFTQQITAQQQANQADQGAVQESNFRNGGEYTPSIAAGTLQNAISNGIAKVTNLDQQAALTMAKLQEGFDAQDYQKINDHYDQLDKLLTDKSNSIKDIFSAAVANEKDIRDYNNKVQQQAVAQTNADRSFKETQMKDAADIQHQKNADYIAASGTWAMHDNPDGTQSLVNSRTGAVQDISPQNIVTGTGTPGNSGIPLVDNNTKTTGTGIPYVDGSALTGKDATAAQNAAAKLMIPYVSKDSATILGNIETSRANIQNVQNDLQGLNPSSGATRPFVALGHAVEGMTQSGPGSTQLNSFAADQSSLIQTIKGMMSLKIVNRGELNTIINGGGMPTPNDTAAVAQAKIAKINNALNTAEKGIMGNTVYDKFNSDSAVNDLQGFASASPEHSAQVDSIRQANPGITPYQVMQLVQP